jgi:hypothetical protein
MDNQFCKKCGQANFPEARVCTKCGAGLSGQFARGAFSASGEPPPTIISNQRFSGPNNPAEKKNNKLFWIIGGTAVFLVLAVGGLGILAAIGGIVYFQSKEQRVEREYPVPPRREEKADDQPLEDKSPGEVSDSQLIDYMRRKRSNVGNYRLDNVKGFKGDDFPNRSAGVTALYTNGSRKVVHSIAMFRSPAAAFGDFSRYKRAIRNLRGSRVRSSSGSQIVYSYKGNIFLTFCNEAGGCHEMISQNGNNILDYSDNYFDKSSYKPKFK